MKLIGPSPQAYLAYRRILQVAGEETTLTTKSNEARARAEASFRKEERAKEGAKAMMEYQANLRMVREKTERLKALRLAKEAADKGAPVSLCDALKRTHRHHIQRLRPNWPAASRVYGTC
jgi:hypothetical protein